MRAAILQARAALAADDVPVGALIINPSGSIVGRGNNQREELDDPTAHAEIVALRQAALTAGNWRLDGHTLVVTLEPCAMCAGAIAQSRVKTVAFGAWDPKAGGGWIGLGYFARPTEPAPSRSHFRSIRRRMC